MLNAPSQSATGSTDAILLTQEKARALALEAGFTEAGLVALPHGNQERDAERFEEWVRAGRAGTMRYLERSGIGRRWAVAAVASGDSVPVGALGGGLLGELQQPAAALDRAGRRGSGMDCALRLVEQDGCDGARRPSDYHKVLLKRLKALEARLHEEFGI